MSAMTQMMEVSTLHNFAKRASSHEPDIQDAVSQLHRLSEDRHKLDADLSMLKRTITALWSDGTEQSMFRLEKLSQIAHQTEGETNRRRGKK
ncbi:hypothetical protein BJX96DRAFT_53845 [Aspergillus floccosus]